MVGTKFWGIWGALQGGSKQKKERKKKLSVLSVSQACGRPGMLPKSGKAVLERKPSEGAVLPLVWADQRGEQKGSGRQAGRLRLEQAWRLHRATQAKARQEGGQTGLV